jgi:transcriptional regulator with XRE-family HTH domain
LAHSNERNHNHAETTERIRKAGRIVQTGALAEVDKMSNHGADVVSTESEEKIVPSALARSVQARLNQLGRNPFEAARKGGLERSFINDILIGRKKSVRGDNIGRLATALDWTVADMMTRIDGNPSTELRRRRIVEGKTLRELAEAAAVDIDRLERAEYGFAEDGPAALKPDEYQRIADALRVQPEAIVPTAKQERAPSGADPDRLASLMSAAFEELGLKESQATNLALALLAASETPLGPQEPEQAKGLLRVLAQSLARLFSR